jgi:hypothetical protein
MYTLRVRNDVVKMKAGIRPAFLAPPLITLPYFYLDPAWYEAIIFQRWRSDVLYLIGVWSTRTEAHQDEGRVLIYKGHDVSRTVSGPSPQETNRMDYTTVTFSEIAHGL